MSEAGFAAGTGVSIRRRLALAIALILSASGLVITAAAYAYGQQASEEAYDRLLAGAAFQIAQSISAGPGGIKVDLPIAAFEMLALAPEDRVVYRIVDPSGGTVTGYDAVRAPTRGRDDLSFYSALFGEERFRFAVTRRRFAEQAFSGEVSVIVGHTMRARAALATDIAAKAVLIVAASGLVLVALTVFAVRSALSPLARIEEALAARDPKDLSPLDVATPREVEALVGAINRFMGLLSRRVAGMQTMIADTAHQLRTPIAALRAQAELLGEESDPAALRAIASKIETRAIGLGRLTDQLLNQALVVHRADAAPTHIVDLREVAMKIADETDDLFAQAPLRLMLPEAPVWAAGDAFSLTEAVKNLVSNAVRYGLAPITLAVEKREGGAEIVVIDCGSGIAEGEWAGPSRRFSRSADPRPDSAGLGLSIVDAVAASHGGKLVFSQDEGGRFRAALVLPGREYA